MAACIEGHAKVVRRLIEQGNASTDVADEAGNRGLTLAALKGHPDAARVLLLAGVDTEARNHEGLTALMAAASVSHANEIAAVGHVAVAKLLLEMGASAEDEPSAGAGELRPWEEFGNK